MNDQILRCPDPECWTTYEVSDEDPDTSFGLMVNHYRYNMRHCDGKTVETAALAVSKHNAHLDGAL